MKTLPILILILLAGCCEFDFEPEFYVDPRLEPYVTSFYKEAEKHGIPVHRNLIVRIESVDGATGRTSYRGRQTIVIIDQEDYSNASAFYAKQLDTLHCLIENLMYHELGHALLNRDHCDPCYSIMSQRLSTIEYAGRPDKREILINELFNKTPHDENQGSTIQSR